MYRQLLSLLVSVAVLPVLGPARAIAVGMSRDPGWDTTGEHSGDDYGRSVAWAGDVNGDGYADLIVGAPLLGDDVGKVYVYHGSATGLVGVVGSPAWSATGETELDEFGHAVAGAGDVNGDGFDDILVAAVHHSSGRGKVYAYHGGKSGLATTPAWSVAGTREGDALGTAIAGASDVNGDGYADVIIGAAGMNEHSGHAFIFHGGPGGLSGTTESAAWNAGGAAAGHRFGASVSGAHDVNADGFCDVLVGAPGPTNAPLDGTAYVYHGGEGGVATTPAWSVTATPTLSGFGASVAGAGDVDGDGYADVAIGAPYHSAARGRVYVYHGGETGVTGGLAHAAWVVQTDEPDDRLGASVSGARDANGDGYADLLVGVPGARDGGGAVYLFGGSASGMQGDPNSPVWSADGRGEGDGFGQVVAGGGDANGDGFAEVAAGSPGAGTGGAAAVFHGGGRGPSATADWMVEGPQDDADFGRPLRARAMSTATDSATGSRASRSTTTPPDACTCSTEKVAHRNGR